ncbi:MAG TPA: DUF4339 domain-containing protein [Candidatus Paceibacterota bacterium]|nr:DUF4339 domain-containing protein [Verrucomicrobiota bacterium]HRY51697.1 DUF4339 domain-containing protein [Candidatus Paceibacterota bacterium]
MYRIIGGDQQQYGPVSFEELCDWIQQGRAASHTLTQTDDSPNWVPLSELPEFADALARGPKPAGSNPPFAIDASTELPCGASEPRPPLQIGRCFWEGWDLLRNHPGTVFLATGVIMVIPMFLAWAFPVWQIPLQLPPPYQDQPMVLPVWSMVADIFIRGILYGGLFGVLLRLIRGQSLDFAGLLRDLGSVALQLILASITTTILITIGCLFCLLPGIYLTVAYLFTYVLIMDRRLNFWAAMEASRRRVNANMAFVFGLAFLLFALNGLAMLLHPFVLFLTLSYSMGVMARAYEDLWSKA